MVVPVMGGYFQTMGGRIRFGREFTDAEVHAGASLAVVDERFAAEFGAPRDAIGRKLTAGRRTWTIVGVAEGMAFETDPSVSAEPQNFVPSSTPGGFFSTIVARVDGVERLAAVRDAIRSVDPQVSVFGASTMEQRLADTFERPRFYRTAIWLFAGFALLVAVIGIYATVSYGVAQRTREIGVRLALGTTPARLRGMVLRQGLVTVIAGALPGIAGALLSGRLLTGLMEGAAPAGVAPAILAACGIACVAVIAIWRATRRIAVLDIATALRCE
jgi:ABC-type antimicrobial peptide transport system permease subunit